MPVIRFFSSLRLTVVCLVLWIILIFVATLSQVDLGIFFAKKQFLDSWIVFWQFSPSLTLPVFPGGLLVGCVILINLIVAHFTRFKWTWKKSGLWLTHIGLILLLIGGGLTSAMGVESQMAVTEGQTRNYIYRLDAWELAVVSDAGGGQDEVVSIGHHWLEDPGLVSHPSLPFSVKVVHYYSNAELKRGDNSLANRGIGSQLSVAPRPLNKQEIGQNSPTVLVEILANGQSQGVWLLSTVLGMGQDVVVSGKVYKLFMRNQREYIPFSVKLLDFRHDVYTGTQIPKNFSSKVDVTDLQSSTRETYLISMNHPLRHKGLTFYQASFGDGDTTSIFQVVKNGVWWMPYLSCGLIFLGLLVHMGLMLWKGLKRV